MLVSRVLYQLSISKTILPRLGYAYLSSGQYKPSGELRYTSRHEWIQVDGSVGTVGMSEYATKQLGDIVYIELPQPNRKICKDTEIGVVESAKAATELYSPVSGCVKETNATIERKPSLLNKYVANDGWLFKIELTNPEELHKLMTETEYQDFLSSENC